MAGTRAHIPQSQIASEASRILANYLAHEADFKSYRPKKFDDAFKNHLQNDINEFTHLPSDAALKAAAATENATLKKIIDDYRILHDELDAILNDLPSEEDAIRAEFGFGRSRAITASAESLHRFLLDLPKVFAKYTAELAALDMPKQLYDGFIALEGRLAAQLATHASVVDGRHSATENRAAIIADLCFRLDSIDNAAEVLYRTNPATRLLFVFDKSRPTKQTKSTPLPTVASPAN